MNKNEFSRHGKEHIYCCFQVYSLVPVPDRTPVTVVASNDDYPNAQVRNHTCEFKDNVAEFTDLRFVGRSGRSKAFDVVITIGSTPPTIAVLSEVIKVFLFPATYTKYDYSRQFSATTMG